MNKTLVIIKESYSEWDFLRSFRKISINKVPKVETVNLNIFRTHNLSDDHLPDQPMTIWIFPIFRSRLKTACCLTLDWLANYFCVCESSSSINVCNSTSSYFWRFSTFLVCDTEVTILKCRNHRSHVSFHETCSP